MGCSSLGTGPAWGHKSCLQTCSSVDSLYRSCQEPPAWASHRLTVSFRHSPAAMWGSPWAAEGLPDSPGSATGAEGKLFSSTWGTSTPSSLTWVPAQLFLSHILTPLSVWHCYCRKFFPFLTVLCQRHCHSRDGVSLGQSVHGAGWH